MLRHPELLGEPVALTVNFAAALADGEFEVAAPPVRTNRSTQHWTCRCRRAMQTVVAPATGFTALRRDTWGGHEAADARGAAPAATSSAGIARRGVEWLRRYEMRSSRAPSPRKWDGSERTAKADAPVGARRPAAPAGLPGARRDERHVLSARLAAPRHAGADRHRLDDDLLPCRRGAAGRSARGYLLGRAQGQGFRNGYFDQTAQLWSEAGELLATTHQIVYYKE